MKIKIIIFSYQRQQMLESLINEVKEYDYTIIDDGSSFKLSKNFHQFQHGGKPKFWRMWDFALRMLRDNHSDLFIFMPSDVSNVNIPKIIELHNQFKAKPYAYNLINDGRTNCWNMIQPVQVDEHTMKVGFTDCGFFCNKQLLNRIGYYVNEINPPKICTQRSNQFWCRSRFDLQNVTDQLQYVHADKVTCLSRGSRKFDA